MYFKYYDKISLKKLRKNFGKEITKDIILMASIQTPIAVGLKCMGWDRNYVLLERNFVEEIKEVLGSEHLKVLIAHEEGHIKLQTLNEEEADNFAIKRYGKEKFEKIIKDFVTFAAQRSGGDLHELVKVNLQAYPHREYLKELL